jgi:hypothetical protein
MEPDCGIASKNLCRMLPCQENENGKMENTGPGGSTRDQKVFDVLADKFGKVDFTPYTSTDCLTGTDQRVSF